MVMGVTTAPPEKGRISFSLGGIFMSTHPLPSCKKQPSDLPCRMRQISVGFAYTESGKCVFSPEGTTDNIFSKRGGGGEVGRKERRRGWVVCESARERARWRKAGTTLELFPIYSIHTHRHTRTHKTTLTQHWQRRTATRLGSDMCGGNESGFYGRRESNPNSIHCKSLLPFSLLSFFSFACNIKLRPETEDGANLRS